MDIVGLWNIPAVFVYLIKLNTKCHMESCIHEMNRSHMHVIKLGVGKRNQSCLRLIFIPLPFLKMCILSRDSSTLPSASMTPGKARRAPGRAGELSAAILPRRQTSVRRVHGELASSSAICRALPPPSILRACSFTPRTGERDLLWRAATTEPRRANKRSSFDRFLLSWSQSSHGRLAPSS